MKTNLLLCCGLVLLAGCAAPAPDVTTHYDQATGQRTDLMGDNLLETQTPGQPRELVWLNAFRDFKSYDQKKAAYYLEVSYMARTEVGYLEIPPGETLTLIVDGQPMKFDSTGSSNLRKRYQKDLVRENAIYSATKAQVEKITSAREVKVKVRGRNGLIERDFGPANFERFRRFLALQAD